MAGVAPCGPVSSTVSLEDLADDSASSRSKPFGQMRAAARRAFVANGARGVGPGSNLGDARQPAGHREIDGGKLIMAKAHLSCTPVAGRCLV
nr:hypothetical protein CFP56_63990 [Quercus suber]